MAVLTNIKDLRPGDVVVALNNLDQDAANVPVGEYGVVFEECISPYGPLVRWIPSGGVCNVYNGEVQKVSK